MRHFTRIEREPPRKPPNWADRLIDVLIEHQVAFSMLLWSLIVGAFLVWWMA